MQGQRLEVSSPALGSASAGLWAAAIALRSARESAAGHVSARSGALLDAAQPVLDAWEEVSRALQALAGGWEELAGALAQLETTYAVLDGAGAGPPGPRRGPAPG